MKRRAVNRSITYDVPDHTAGHPGIGDYLLSRLKDGHYGTAYLIVGARLVKPRKPHEGFRRYALTVQREAEISVEVLRLARWWLRWHPRSHPVARPELIGA